MNQRGHRHKSKEEKEILQECINECNALPKKSSIKREIWTKYANLLNSKGYSYTSHDVYVYVNNNTKPNNTSSENPPNPQQPISQSTTPEPPSKDNATISPTSPYQPLLTRIPFITNESSTPSSIPSSDTNTLQVQPPLPPPPPPPAPNQPLYSPQPSTTQLCSPAPLKQNSPSKPPTNSPLLYSFPSNDDQPLPNSQAQQSPSRSPTPSPTSSTSILPVASTDDYDSSAAASSLELPFCLLYMEKDLINNLPKVPDIKDKELNIDEFDRSKYELYNNCLQVYYKALSYAHSYFQSKVSPSDGRAKFMSLLLEFQKKVEKLFVESTTLLSDKLRQEHVYSYDSNYVIVKTPKYKRTVSRTTRLYNSEDISPLPSSLCTTDFQHSFLCSADQYKGKEQEKEKEKECIETDEYTIESYLEKKDNLINVRLRPIYNAEFNQKKYVSIKLLDVETSTIISNSTGCDFAYVKYLNNSHVLHYRDLSVETGFFLPTTAIYYHHFDDTDTDAIYVCGDQRIKEFTLLEGEMKNTNTFFFGVDYYQSSAITVWDNELVFCCDSNVFFWDIKETSNSPTLTNKAKFKSDKNLKRARTSGIDIQKVDWCKGKPPKPNKLEIDTMKEISAVTVINCEESNESFLAISSESYPVIYVFDRNHQNVARLISHTMGVTFLTSISNILIAGSIDFTVTFWDIEKFDKIQTFDTQSQPITVIELCHHDNKDFVFTGGEDGTVIAWSFTDKKPLFEIKLEENFVPRKIALFTEKNQNGREVDKLMIISSNEGNIQRAFKTCNIQIFEFN